MRWPPRRARRLRPVVLAVVGSVVLGGALPAASPDVERRIDELLGRMTLEEKLGQLQQLDGEAQGTYRPEHLELAVRGGLGSTLNVRGARSVNELQRAAVERAASIAAAEARAAGVQWTFAPMVDVARDARWGRIAEGAGEDPYLGSAMARARVRGFQGGDYGGPDKVVACAKHWVAYGAAEGGRDYDTTDVSERTLRSVYFPPFRAAVDAGVGSVMSAFNGLDGVPSSANPFTLTAVLRKEWGFDGMVVSDYTSVRELVNHGVAEDEADAARQALSAGVDMEMVSRTYASHVPRLVAEGRLPVAVVDEAVRRVLRIKLRAGLFEAPYADPERERATLMKPEHRAAAREVAARSMVLLRNEGGVLPLSPSIRRLAVIGPLADDAADMMGNWTGDGRAEDAVTVLAGIKAAVASATLVTYAKGVTVDLAVLPDPGAHDASDAAGIDEAARIASGADAAVLVVGETGAMSGEAASRASLDLPGRQLELARRVIATGKPTAIVLMNGRPLTIPWLAEHAGAILEAWFPGTEGGHAVADVLFGNVNPGGKLPVTFPRAVGQVPIHHDHMSTGRPPDERNKYTSKYLDVPWTPLYPFGHGLSYTQFKLSRLRLSQARIPPDGQIVASVDLENAGGRAGDEVVQLYLRDVAASVTRPVQELAAFQRVTLGPGESRTLQFTLASAQLGFYDRDMKWVVEPGLFRVRVGTSSEGGLEGSFEVGR